MSHPSKLKGNRFEREIVDKAKKLPAYLIPSEEVDAVVFKQDRGEILMLLRYEDWLFEQKRFDELKQIGFDVLTNKKDK